MDFEMISPEMLDLYIDRNDVKIIDLRSGDAYEKGHIKGAIHIPFDRKESFACIPKNVELILYCERGSASLMKGRQLAEQGYRVKSVVGGISEYKGDALVKNL